MGKIVICDTKEARTPFIFENTRAEIFSYEELCYYLYHNTILVTKDLLKEQLAVWIKEELGMEELSGWLMKLVRSDAPLEHRIRTILTAANYYDKEEVTYLFERMKGEANLPEYEFLKRQADCFLSYHKYVRAIRIYDSILEIHGLDDSYISAIHHNEGVAYARNFEYQQAVDQFWMAYEVDQNEVSLRAVMLLLAMDGHGESVREICEKKGVSDEVYFKLKKELQSQETEIEEAPYVKRVEEIKGLRCSGDVQGFYQESQKLIREWKQEYRQEMN